jgi:hypothetical protein
MRHRERGTRNSQPGQDPSDLDRVLEALLAGYPLPDEDPAGLQPVADVLTALRQPAAPAELTGQASALAEFRARPRRTAAVTWPRRRGGPVRGPLLRPRPATALLAGAVVVAGLAAGAYEGDLPGPVQQWAHHTFGLTAARSKAPHPEHPGRPATASPPPASSQHRRHSPAQPSPSQYGQGEQHRDSHRAADRDGHQHGDQPGNPDPSSPSSPSSSPSPSAPATPEPSTSPAAQPSTQSSTAPGPHSSPSSPP